MQSKTLVLFFPVAELMCKAEHWASVQWEGEMPALMFRAGSVSMGFNTDVLDLGGGKIYKTL